MPFDNTNSLDSEVAYWQQQRELISIRPNEVIDAEIQALVEEIDDPARQDPTLDLAVRLADKKERILRKELPFKTFTEYVKAKLPYSPQWAGTLARIGGQPNPRLALAEHRCYQDEAQDK